MASSPQYHLNLPEQFWEWYHSRDRTSVMSDAFVFRRTHSRAETIREFKPRHITMGRLREHECNVLALYINHMHKS